MRSLLTSCACPAEPRPDSGPTKDRLVGCCAFQGNRRRCVSEAKSESKSESRQKDKDTADAGRAGHERPFRFGLTDPSPLSGVANLWRSAAQVATIGIFLV